MQVVRSFDMFDAWVTDHGEGIPSAEQAHIFTQFYRLREQDRHISGLGLGLYITK